MNIDVKRSEIIKRIEKISDKNRLLQLDSFLAEMERKNTLKAYEFCENPLAQTNLEQLIQEQNYDPQNLKGMGGILGDENEPLEELLQQL